MTDRENTPVHLTFSAAGVRACLARRTQGEPLVLMGDAVYVATDPTPLPEPCMALASDLTQRGISTTTLSEALQLIDYPALVRLLAEYGPSVSWR